MVLECRYLDLHRLINFVISFATQMGMATDKSTAISFFSYQELESFGTFVNNFATETGVAPFKSAATPFSRKERYQMKYGFKNLL